MYDPTTGRDFRTPNEKTTDNIIPDFFIKANPNAFRSQQEGRACYDDVEMVRMIIPGDRNCEPVAFVTDEHRRRWPDQYAAFKEGTTLARDGTPIEEWPPLSPAQVLELKALKIPTVEALASISDHALNAIGMGARDLRDRAQAWLAANDHGKAREAELIAQLDEQRLQIEALQTAVVQLQATPVAPSSETSDTTPRARRARTHKD